MDLNIKQFMDSTAYENQKAVIRNLANTLRQEKLGCASISLGDPRRLHTVDYSVFHKDIHERAKLHTLKKQHVRKPLQLIGRYEF